MSLNKQFVLGESATKKQGIDEMPSFVHAFYNVTSSVLQEKEKKHSPSFQAIFRGLQCTYSTHQPRGRSQGCRGTERTLGTRLIVFAHDVMSAILVSQNSKMAAMLVNQTNPVRVKLFSCAIALVCSKNFAWLVARE